MRVCPEAIWIWLKWKFAIYRFWHKCEVPTGSEIVRLLGALSGHRSGIVKSTRMTVRPEGANYQ